MWVTIYCAFILRLFNPKRRILCTIVRITIWTPSRFLWLCTMYKPCTHRISLLNLPKHMVRKFVHPSWHQHHLHQNLHMANHCHQLRETTTKLTNERPFKWICIYGNELYHRYKCAVKVGTRARASERPYKRPVQYKSNRAGEYTKFNLRNRSCSPSCKFKKCLDVYEFTIIISTKEGSSF